MIILFKRQPVRGINFPGFHLNEKMGLQFSYKDSQKNSLALTYTLLRDPHVELVCQNFRIGDFILKQMQITKTEPYPLSNFRFEKLWLMQPFLEIEQLAFVKNNCTQNAY